MALTIADMILRQTHFYNGHGQMEITEMHITDVVSTLNELEEKQGGDTFTLKLYGDAAGSIYRENSDNDEPQLLFGIEKVTFT